MVVAIIIFSTIVMIISLCINLHKLQSDFYKHYFIHHCAGNEKQLSSVPFPPKDYVP